jgi:nucleoside-diphosphate-sugar epimerase
MVVTGSSGFIGSHLCAVLRGRGKRPVGIDALECLADDPDSLSDPWEVG